MTYPVSPGESVTTSANIAHPNTESINNSQESVPAAQPRADLALLRRAQALRNPSSEVEDSFPSPIEPSFSISGRLQHNFVVPDSQSQTGDSSFIPSGETNRALKVNTSTQASVRSFFNCHLSSASFYNSW